MRMITNSLLNWLSPSIIICLTMIATLVCMMMYCLSKKRNGKNNNDKGLFNITKYSELYEDDLSNVNNVIYETLDTPKNINDKHNVWCCRKNNKSTDNNDEHKNNDNIKNNDNNDDDDNDNDERDNNERVYIYYHFDEMGNTKKTFMSSESDDSFNDLDGFVDIIINGMDSKRTTILLRISSLGGHAHKYCLAYTQLSRLREKGFHLIAFVDDICASGGYMLACACNEIICSRYATIGSVGVATSIINYSELINKYGVVKKNITTGSHKLLFSDSEAFTDDDINRVREAVDETMDVFADIVQRSRKLTDDELLKITNGKTWYGYLAKELKLIDDIELSDNYMKRLLDDGNEIFIFNNNDEQPEKNNILSLLMNNLIMFSNVVGLNDIMNVSNVMNGMINNSNRMMMGKII